MRALSGKTGLVCFTRKGERQSGNALTHRSNNLTLQSELVLIPASNPARLPISPDSDIRRILDSVPHVPRRESQDKQDASRSPTDPALHDRQDIVPQRVRGKSQREEGSGDNDKRDGVERHVQLEVGWREAANVRVERLGGEAAAGQLLRYREGTSSQGPTRALWRSVDMPEKMMVARCGALTAC